MAEEEPKGLWRRLKDKLTGANKPPPPVDPAEEMTTPIKGEESKPQAQEPSKPEAGDEPKKEPIVLSTSELKTDTVGRVYAQALLELATEQGVVDEVADEVQQLLPLISDGGDLHRLLVNPAIGDQERGQIIQRIFEGKVSGLLYTMLRVMGDKGRLGSISEVASGYLLAVAEARGQIDVQAFVASELDSAAVQQVAQQIGQAFGKTVSVSQQIDPSLIGGMKIKVGDRLIDASVASQLRNMKNKMIAAGRG